MHLYIFCLKNSTQFHENDLSKSILNLYSSSWPRANYKNRAMCSQHPHRPPRPDCTGALRPHRFARSRNPDGNTPFAPRSFTHHPAVCRASDDHTARRRNRTLHDHTARRWNGTLHDLPAQRIGGSASPHPARRIGRASELCRGTVWNPSLCRDGTHANRHRSDHWVKFQIFPSL